MSDAYPTTGFPGGYAAGKKARNDLEVAGDPQDDNGRAAVERHLPMDAPELFKNGFAFGWNMWEPYNAEREFKKGRRSGWDRADGWRDGDMFGDRLAKVEGHNPDGDEAAAAFLVATVDAAYQSGFVMGWNDFMNGVTYDDIVELTKK